MNFVKKKINEKLNYSDIIKRLKVCYNLKHDKELAKLCDISAEMFSGKKKSLNLLNEFIYLGLNRNINLNWLFTGEGQIYLNKDNDSFSNDIVKRGDFERELSSLRNEIDKLKNISQPGKKGRAA